MNAVTSSDFKSLQMLSERRLQLTHDFSNAYHNPRDPNQTFSCFSELHSCSNTRPIHPTVER